MKSVCLFILCASLNALFLATPGARAAEDAAAHHPPIHKRGTLALNIVETTPFVFHGKLYRLEWLRSAGCLRIMDHATECELCRFGAKHRFPCAYVASNTVYVVGTRDDQGWYGTGLDMFTSTDLTNWQQRAIFSDPEIGICNTSLCKAGERYVMSIELSRPGGFPARFLESKDLLNWKLAPKECRHQLGRYNAAHCLRWHDGWFYLFYLEANRPHGYEQYVTRSRDLIHWDSSLLNPVLAASPEDRLIANPALTQDERSRIAKAADVNNSDIDFCDFHGHLIINYSWGNQQGTEFLAEASYPGTTADFLTVWFPNSN